MKDRDDAAKRNYLYRKMVHNEISANQRPGGFPPVVDGFCGLPFLWYSTTLDRTAISC